jgi:tRNA U54 and U55 pseudouridine synthase Pus10
MSNQLQKDELALKYKAFIDMIQSESFAVFRAHLEIVQAKYKRDIVQFLRSSDEAELVGIKCRLAQQAIDIIENIFTVHVDEIKRELNPEVGKRTYERLDEQGGQLY